jgi:rhodanese-related sulfurtransferase
MSYQQIAVVVALAAAWFFLFRFGKTSSAEARRLVAAGARLVDVRTPGEFGGGHLPGALNIPLDQLQGRVGELKKESTPVVLYCASGMRSGQAKRLLTAAGLAAVHDLGAMSRW